MRKYVMYLGLPALCGRNKTASLNFITERLESKLQGWKGKLLSQAGREMLLKSVAMAIPIYAMQCFKLPSTFCSAIYKKFDSFFWGNSSKTGKGVQWRSWFRLAVPKRIGGMGFRDIEKFNSALLAKQVWILFSNTDTLCARLLRGIYHPFHSILEARGNSKPSWAWRSLIEGINVLNAGVCKNIGNGQRTCIWLDKWVPSLNSFSITSPPPSREVASYHMIHLIDPELRIWNQDMLRKYFTVEERMAIKQIPISNTETADSYVWHYSPNGVYGAKSGYQWLMDNVDHGTNPGSSNMGIENDIRGWKELWDLKTIRKVKNFIWRACHNALATGENLVKKQINIYLGCHRCGAEPETIEHVLFLYPNVIK